MMPGPRVSKQDRTLLNRLSFGITPALVADMQAAGNAKQWMTQQMQPQQVKDITAARMTTWFPVLSKTPQQQYRDFLTGTATVYDMGIQLGNWTILRRAYSKRQLLEVMVSFWSDMLHIPVSETKSWPLRISYDMTIRKHALGRFDDLLVAVETHGAMGAFLDNATSTTTKLNENLGRETLELHTVGINAGYTEAEVVDSARILTGYRVDLNNTWSGYYSPQDHYVGRVQVLGFASENMSTNGQPSAEAYLRYLARHPQTALRLARRLCQRLVSDAPSPALVQAVAEAYSASETDVKATLRALVSHPEFAASADRKVKTPTEDLVSTYRALGIVAKPPASSTDLANVAVLQAASMGQRPFGWPRPDGPPDVGHAWASVSRVLASWYVHYGAAERWTPATGCTYADPTSWLPSLPAAVSDIIRQAAQVLLCRGLSAVEMAAIAKRIGLLPSARVTRAEMSDWRIGLMLAGLLDSPAHMMR